MTPESVKEIAQLATNATAASVLTEGDVKMLVFPTGEGKVEVRSLKPEIDAFRTAPDRRRGTAKASTLDSFVDLVNRHKDEGSAIFGSIDTAQPKFIAVVDYHAIDHSPRFGQHRIEYVFPISDEWAAWRGRNGASMDQSAFASFVEDHVAELSAPYDAERGQIEGLFGTKFGLPSELIQLSRGLALNVESTVKEIRVLQSGEAQIQYDEVHKDGAGKPLTVPGLFVISIPLFVGAEPTRLIARLRYRRDNGIKWSFHLWRWAEAVRQSLISDLDRAAKDTGLPTFEAMPEA